MFSKTDLKSIAEHYIEMLKQGHEQVGREPPNLAIKTAPKESDYFEESIIQSGFALFLLGMRYAIAGPIKPKKSTEKPTIKKSLNKPKMKKQKPTAAPAPAPAPRIAKQKTESIGSKLGRWLFGAFEKVTAHEVETDSDSRLASVANPKPATKRGRGRPRKATK